MKKLLLSLSLTVPVFCSAQYVFNAAYQSLKFGGPGVTIVNKVGTGSTAGSVVLYQNVVTIGGQQIDAIIRTQSLSAGALMVLDQQGTGTGYTNNNPTWFSPQFLFPAGGGSAVFNFEFILGNSYNNATNTGTPVTLQNIMINSYDIDGNDSVGSKQHTEFGGFFTTELANTTSLSTSYNPVTNLTSFSSTIDTNVINAADPNTRVRVAYEELNNFQVSVGAGAAGVAYFFIDFDMGAPFGVPTTITTAPTLDLNTNTPGSDNTANHCTSAVSFTAGSTNISSLGTTPSGGTSIERLKIYFSTSQIADGSAERLLVSGATSGGIIALNFANGGAIPDINLSGTTYSVTATVVNGESALTFMKSGSSTMSINEGEQLLDAFQYNDISASPTGAPRIFKVRVKDGALESMPAYFTVGVGTFATITQQAADTIIPAGSDAVFSVVATATSYQWQVNTGDGVFTNVTNSAIYSGATTSTLTLTGVPYSMNNYVYRVITGNACTVNSSTANLSVLMLLANDRMKFGGVDYDSHILLTWTASNDVNSSLFIVEYSTDGKLFARLDSLPAKTNGTRDVTYQYSHTGAASGANYYRIVQVNKNGQLSYSQVIRINRSEQKHVQVVVNPVTNGQLRIRAPFAGPVILFDAAGRAVRKEMTAAGDTTVNVGQLPSGVYTLVSGRSGRQVVIKN